MVAKCSKLISFKNNTALKIIKFSTKLIELTYKL